MKYSVISLSKSGKVDLSAQVRFFAKVLKKGPLTPGIQGLI